MPEPLLKKINTIGIPFLGSIPNDENLLSFELDGRPLVELGADSTLYKIIADMMEKILFT
jgi:CO dehydrogenase nickel-insertion accessory protein CooC1